MFGKENFLGILYIFKTDLFNHNWLNDSYNGFLSIAHFDISNDIPFILLVSNFVSEEDKITMYSTLLNGTNENMNKLTKTSSDSFLRNHFVAVTGIIDDQIKDDVILIVSSWAKKYYISYRELMSKTQNDLLCLNIYGIGIWKS